MHEQVDEQDRPGQFEEQLLVINEVHLAALAQQVQRGNDRAGEAPRLADHRGDGDDESEDAQASDTMLADAQASTK